MIIGMLVLVSFFIPAESGERIGLCATILLAVSVYLLVVTEQLPEQSETLPLIGVYYIVIMFEIGLALAATVLVLMAHHATSEPPRFLACITGKSSNYVTPNRTQVHYIYNDDGNSKGNADDDAIIRLKIDLPIYLAVIGFRLEFEKLFRSYVTACRHRCCRVAWN